MTQHDYNIANQGAASFRSDLNNAWTSIISNNSGSSAPSTSVVAFYNYADSTNLVMYYRNSGNTAWLPKINLDSDMVLTKTTTYSMVAGDHLKCIECDATTAAFTVPVYPSSSALEGFEVTVKKTDSGTNTVTVTTTNTIDGSSQYILSNQYESVTIRSNGSNWDVMASNRGVATQAQQETGTNITAVVTPGRQHYHNSAGKSWVRINVTSSAGTPSVTVSYNVTSVTDNGVGDFSINFTNAFSTINYAGAGIAGYGSGFGYIRLHSSSSLSTNAYRVQTLTNGGSGVTDVNVFDMCFFGDLP